MSATSVDCRHRSAVDLAPTSPAECPSPARRPSPCSGLSMYSLVALLIATLVSPSESISCDLAQVKCAYRTGCGLSLNSYMVECSGLIRGTTDKCHKKCKNALVALASTEEGADLVTCDCEGSKYCEKSKKRIQVCRSAVDRALAKDTIVSCQTAQWICMADALCRTALEYYQMNCRGLLHGNKCSSKCKNSLSILERQEKAAKLRTCFCDGTEGFDCKRMKYNTERFCYSRIPPHSDLEIGEPDNSISRMGSDEFRGHSSKRHKHKHHIVATSAAVPLQSVPLLILTTALAIAANRFRSNIARILL